MANRFASDLWESVKSDSASEIIAQLGDVTLGKLLSDTILANVPLFGTANSLLKAGNDLHAYLFTKKVCVFLIELESISKIKRQRFVEKNLNSDARLESTGEELLFILNSANNTEICSLLGKAFSLYIQGVIDASAFELYRHAIAALNPYLIKQIKQCYRTEGLVAINADAHHLLMSYGILSAEFLPTRSHNQLSFITSPKTTHFGKAFYENLLA